MRVMGRTRRGLLVTAAASAATLVVAPGARAAERARPRQRAALVELPAMSADDVVDRYGVGIHLNFLNTPYRDADAVVQALTDLGVRHVRDDLYLDAPRQYDAIAKVAAQGIGFDLIMGRPTVGAPEDYVATVAGQLPAGAVESIEGANEWDLFGGDGWAAEVLDWQQRLYAAAKAEPATEQLPVLSPALAFRWNYPQVGDLSPWADVANAHMYPGGYQPSHEITRITRAVRESLPDEPLVTTEAGYNNATSNTGSHPGVPEDVSGIYLPRLLLVHVGRGEQRMYSYELIDSFDDPDGSNAEAHFGLLNHDLSPKPAYLAMQRLIALLSDRGPAFTPESLGVTPTGLPADARYVLTQKRDGTFVLLLWRDVAIYDPVAQQPIEVAPVDVTLAFAAEKDVTVHRPSTSGEPVARRTGAELPLRLDGELLAIEIAPSADPEPEPELVPTAPAIASLAPGRRKVTVAWRAADGRGHPVTAYRLKVLDRTVVVAPDALRRTIKGLPRRTRLRVGIQAQNAIGWSTITWSRYVRTK